MPGERLVVEVSAIEPRRQRLDLGPGLRARQRRGEAPLRWRRKVPRRGKRVGAAAGGAESQGEHTQ